MAIYHLYYLKNGMLIGSDDIDAADDREAARTAAAQGQGDLVEIWNQSSRVRIVKPGGVCGRLGAAAADSRAPA